jgi:radical SAM superfamily enzyme YgiQ (UPF0313 family)
MKNKKNKKIILNYLPPALSNSPSHALCVLKGFLSHYGYHSKIINWNTAIHNLMASHLPFFNVSPWEFDVLLIIPFLMEIAGKYNDAAANERILSCLYSMYPKYTMKMISSGNHIHEQLKTIVFQSIDSELETMDNSDVILSGFSAKFYQWIPGMVMAEKLKKRFPGIRIVIGGFGSQKDAGAVMSICPYYDFAIWGEGEYPLLELLHRLEDETGTYHLESVPRLVYREQQDLKITTCRSKYVDFDRYIYPDFTDSINTIGDTADTKQFKLTLETSRGCHWNRCRFCYMNVGYQQRRRSPESIIHEIEFMSSRYENNLFLVVDSDVVGTDLQCFERLLDLVIESSQKHQVIYQFQVEIIHHGFNSRIIKKMALAGFTRVQIGYEAITDELLKKIDKKTDFSDLILFVKFALEFGIETIGANIIRGIVGETAADVLESLENLPFLRFFLNSRPGNSGISHTLIKLRLEPGSRFFHLVSEEDKKRWNYHPAAYLLPESFIDSDKRSQLFGFYAKLENEIEWDQFEKVNKFYHETEFKYQVLEHAGLHYYKEFMNGEPINYIIFNKPEYWEVLKAANDAVTSFKEISRELKEKFPTLTDKGLIEIIEMLKADYLLYANKDLTRVVSVIDAR